MVYLQITLLLLVVLTQILRPDVVARWNRLWNAKLYLATSVGTTPVLLLLSRLGVLGKEYVAVIPWQTALEGIFLTIAVCCYLFCLRGGSTEAAREKGEER